MSGRPAAMLRHRQKKALTARLLQFDNQFVNPNRGRPDAFDRLLRKLKNANVRRGA